MRNPNKKRKKPERRELGWDDVGRGFSTTLGSFTLLRKILKPMGIGLDFIPWLLKKRRGELIEFFQERGREFFKEIEEKENLAPKSIDGQVKIFYTDEKMEARFKMVKPKTLGKVLLLSRTLTRQMDSTEMKAEFQPEVVTEADILATIRAGVLPRGCLCLFFLDNCVVRVNGHDNVWYVSAYPVGYVIKWYVGSWVFSRKFRF